jgi:2-polyprenyl-3-methyl-5-hydroxy-6-metoxy-1,4-benzoquinol methylase
VPDEPPANPPDVARLLESLRHRVEQRRREGTYPPELETELDGHFARVTGDRLPSTAQLVDQLDHALDELQHFGFSRDHISTASSLPGGGMLHRAIAKGVGRQIEGVLAQAQEQSQRVATALALMAHLNNLLADMYDTRVLQQLDDLHLRLNQEHRQLNDAIASLRDVTARVPGAAVETWYSADTFVDHFRGAADDIHDRYRDLAARLAGCAPVLDVGFGRGEFLELLRDLGIDAMGIEPVPALVEAARTRGLRAEVGSAFEYLGDLDDGALGGLVMIQVIEHLAPQHVIDVVRLASAKVRPGGRVVVETVNPTSLYTYAHAFWVDPDHVRPVHPAFLRFLFAEAGFATVEFVERSPVPEDESLELLPGDDELVKRLNVNFERINGLLFGPQDYAIVATR